LADSVYRKSNQGSDNHNQYECLTERMLKSANKRTIGLAMTRDSQSPPAFLTPAELAARWKITTMTLRRWRHRNTLKAHHLGRGIRFALSEVERFEREAQA
jgi:excisionase family DNA binding protein